MEKYRTIPIVITGVKMSSRVRHFVSNVVCACIPTRSLRDRVRVMIRYPETFDYVRFVREYCHDDCNIKIRVGRGCRNFVILAGNRYVFKFPLFSDGRDVAYREKRISDALRPISPIKIPEMEIITFQDVFVRKYEYAHGELLNDKVPGKNSQKTEKIAKQIANFMYVIGRCNPREIRDLKDTPNAKPDYMYGWFHGDIGQNFLLDAKTGDITYFIDWEDTRFQSFLPGLRLAAHTWDKYGYRGLIVDVLAEYSKLYLKSQDK